MNEALPPQSLETPEAEKYPYCNSETFKADISELCEKCPLIDLIQNGIVNQVEFQAKQKKEVLTMEQLTEYVKGEVENASKAMEKAHLEELQRPDDKRFRPRRIERYIWNKERIKVLNTLLGQWKVLESQDNRIEQKFSYTEKRINHFTQVLQQYGFFALQKVKTLSKDGQAQLVYFIASNKLPYCIAMFDFLGFLEQLKNEYFKTKTDLNIQISKWFDADKQGRTVAGNIRVLSTTDEDKSRYTAYRHKKKVMNDYENIK